jgi:hypothetical protein
MIVSGSPASVFYTPGEYFKKSNGYNANRCENAKLRGSIEDGEQKKLCALRLGE